jgi:hypothetical protein
METQFEEVMDILKLKHKLHHNSTSKEKITTVRQQELILEADDKLFDLFGYKKEIL